MVIKDVEAGVKPPIQDPLVNPVTKSAEIAKQETAAALNPYAGESAYPNPGMSTAAAPTTAEPVQQPTQTVTTPAEARQQDYQANKGIVQQPTQTVIDPEEARRQEYQIKTAGKVVTETIKETTNPDGSKDKVVVKEPLKPPADTSTPAPVNKGVDWAAKPGEAKNIKGGTKDLKSGTKPNIPGGLSETPKGGEPAPRPAELTESEKYLKQIQGLKFAYNAQSDPEYRQAASQLENQIAQMMIGRGGLYSSVTNAALQSGLMNLQVSYTKMAYERYLQERDYLFKLADFTAGREDAAWQKQFSEKQYKASRDDAWFARKMANKEFAAGREDAAFQKQMAEKTYKSGREDAEWEKNFNMAKFNADLEQQKFENGLAQQQLAIQRANAAYNRQAAKTAGDAANARALAETTGAKYRTQRDLADRLKAQWASSGYPSAEVQSFFKVSGSTTFFSSGAQNAISNKDGEISGIKNYAARLAEEALAADLVLAAGNDWIATDDPATVAKTTMDGNYNSTKYKMMTSINSAETARQAYNGLMSDKNSLISYMGVGNYEKLLADIKGLETSYRYSMDG